MNANTTPPFITRTHIFTFVFFAIFIFLLYQITAMIAPFSSGLLWAAILCLALNPVYEKALFLFRGRAGLSAGVMTLVLLLLVVGPSIALLGSLAAQAVDLYQWISEFVQRGGLPEAWGRIERSLTLPGLAGIDIKGFLIKGLGEMSSAMASQIGDALKNTLDLMANLLIMLIAMFYFFRNGEAYYRSVMELLPFTDEQKQVIARKFRDTFTAVINGILLVALGQGIMTGIGFAVLGVPFSVFWGFLAFILSILPIGGAALVWVPGVVYLYLKGSALSAIFLSLWGTVISLSDNFVKPLIIGKKANIPSFFLFVGILGGLSVYGFLGVLFGPLVMTLLIAFVQIYREEFANK